jgi:quinolinate synthase
MAKYVQTKTKVQIISWIGTCIVHERFSAQEIEDIKKQNPEIVVLSHPECPPEVIAASDFTGSTSSMNKYVKDNQPNKVMLVTECSMSDNVQVNNPNVQFIKPCNLCPHMKTITLPKVLDCLENEKNEILIPEIISRKARKAVERMVAIGRSH